MGSVDFLSFSTLFLAVLVVFVNGWTDAPSSVFSVVSSGTLKLWQGTLLSAVFNFLGVLIFSFINTGVAKEVLSLVNQKNEGISKITCFSCFLTVVLFGVLTWFFGMPSSESHALISSLAGCSLAFGLFDYTFLSRFLKIVIFMIFSCVLSFSISYAAARLLCKRRLHFEKFLLLSSASLSFMHGAQDGQKFIGVILLLVGASSKSPPLFLVLAVSFVMAFSTLLGGKRIIGSLSKSIKKCDTPLAFFSDFGSFATLFLCSILGMPVSSGNVKSLSLVGSSLAEKSGVNKKIITEILITSVITFPICFILGFLICKAVLLVFRL